VNVYAIFNTNENTDAIINFKSDLDTVSKHEAKNAAKTQNFDVAALDTLYPALHEVYVDYTPRTQIDTTGESAIWITIGRGNMVDGRVFLNTANNLAGAAAFPCAPTNNFNFDFNGLNSADFTALTLQDDLCRNLFYSRFGRYWIGIENRDNSNVNIPITIEYVDPVQLNFGQAQPFSHSAGHYKLFYITIDDSLANDPNVILNVNLNQPNTSRAATIRYGTSVTYPNCGGSSTLNPTFIGNTYVIDTNLTSCLWTGRSGKKLYFSVGAVFNNAIQNPVAGSITITKITRPISGDHASIALSTPVPVALVPSETVLYKFRSASTSPISSNSAWYYRVKATNFDSDPQINIAFLTDTLRVCGSANTENTDLFCNVNRDTCYAVFFPCRIVPNHDYTLRITNTHPTLNISLLVTLEQISKPITDLPVSSQYISNGISLPFGDVQFYHFSLKQMLSYYEAFSFSIQGLSCGTLQYYVDTNSVAGSPCASESSGTLASTLFTTNGCDLTSSLDTEYYVTVVGTNQFVISSPPTFKFSSVISNTATLVNLQPGELDYLKLVPQSVVVAPVCPVPSSPFVPCCEYSNTIQTTMLPENKLWVYTIEGMEYIEEHDQLIIDNPSGFNPTVRLYLEHRSLYQGSDCVASNPNPNPNPITCNSFPCTVDMHDYDFLECPNAAVQLFIRIDVTLQNPVYGSNPINFISLYHKRTPYALQDLVIPASEVPAERFVQFSLRRTYRQLFRFIHPNNLVKQNYMFKASVDSHSTNTQLQLRDQFSRCTGGTTCNQISACRATSYPPACGSFTPTPCSCTSDTVSSLNVGMCNGIGISQRSYVAFYSTSSVAPSQTNTLRLNYYQNILPAPLRQCLELQDGQVSYYTHTFTNPKPTERFNIYYSSISGTASVSVDDGCVNLCSFSGNSGYCSGVRGSSNTLSITITATSHLYYTLDASATNVTYTEIQNGVLHSNPQYVYTPCKTFTGTTMYSYTATGGSAGSNKYLLFEYFTNNNARQMKIFTDHTTSLAPSWSCTTIAGYCRVMVGCGYSATTYFIETDPNVLDPHQIRVTESTATIVDGVWGTNTFTPGLAAPSGLLPGQILSFKFPAKSTQTPDDIISFLNNNLPASVQSWITINKFGDRSCESSTLRPCSISSSVDEFYYVNFFYEGNAVLPCQLKPYFFTANQYSSYGVNRLAPIGQLSANTNITNSLSNNVDKHRYQLSFNPLTNDDVLVISFINPDSTVRLDGEFANYNNGQTLGAPCSCTRTTGFTIGNPAQRQLVLDKCSHCGSSYYNSYFLDVRFVSSPTYPKSSFSYTFDYTVKKYKPLTSTFSKYTLRSDTIDTEFFKVNPTDTAAQRFELEIMGPRGVRVDMYDSNDCTNTPIKTLNCLKGNLCQLPIPDPRNMKDYTASSLFYIKVTGFDTAFQIRYLVGVAALSTTTSQTAPFCSPFVTSVWGPSESLTRRDNHANKLYQELYNDFSCGGSSCVCSPLSDACLSSLKIFACSLSMRTGDTSGQVHFVSNSQCQSVVTNCGKGFESTTNFGHLTCSSGAYEGTDLSTNPRVNPNPPPVELVLVDNASALLSNVMLLLILIILVIVF